MDLSIATWRKSSRSGAIGGNCVEVATGTGVAARDSKDPDGPALIFDAAEWQQFAATVKSGDLNARL